MSWTLLGLLTVFTNYKEIKIDSFKIEGFATKNLCEKAQGLIQKSYRLESHDHIHNLQVDRYAEIFCVRTQ